MKKMLKQTPHMIILKRSWIFLVNILKPSEIGPGESEPK